jgi:hypothetical protein
MTQMGRRRALLPGGVGGVVGSFLPSQRSRRVFGVHSLPLPRDPTMLPYIVLLGHPLLISFSKTPICLHLSSSVDGPRLKTPRTNHDEWPSTGILSKAGTYLGIDEGPIRSPRPAAYYGSHLPLLLGQAFLEFAPQRGGRLK